MWMKVGYGCDWDGDRDGQSEMGWRDRDGYCMGWGWEEMEWRWDGCKVGLDGNEDVDWVGSGMWDEIWMGWGWECRQGLE